MLDDNPPIHNDDAYHQLALDSDHEDINMYGTIKREGAVSSSKQSMVIQEMSEQKEVVPLELIIKGKKEKLTDEEIQKLIDDNYLEEIGGGGVGANSNNALNKDQSIIYYNGKVYDERKKAQYGI